MKIVWLGYSSFIITLASGKVLVFDPYDDSDGYTPQKIAADVVLSSHDHHCLDNITGKYTMVNQPGEYTLDDISISGFETFHDHSGGKKRGLNTIFKVSAEEVNLLHLGALGEVPDKKFLASLGKIDILLLPVGGIYTINEKEALQVIDGISPNIIIPMYYLTDDVTLKLNPIANFLNQINTIYDYAMLGKNEFSISAGDLKKRTRVIIMEYT